MEGGFSIYVALQSEVLLVFWQNYATILQNCHLVSIENITIFPQISLRILSTIRNICQSKEAHTDYWGQIHGLAINANSPHKGKKLFIYIKCSREMHNSYHVCIKIYVHNHVYLNYIKHDILVKTSLLWTPEIIKYALRK